MNDRQWDKGLFEKKYDRNGAQEDPLLETYIQLGALMVRSDRKAYREKIMYLNSYFSKNFPDTHYDFGRSFTEALKNPIKPKSIAKWLNRKLPKQEERLQIIYFLSGLSTVDGAFNDAEIRFLNDLGALLNLSVQEVQAVIAMYEQRNERLNSSRPSTIIISNVELAAKIIGVTINSSIEEVKKSYRTLVKLHHPDLFALHSLEQQNIAEERFIEIHNAYEILIKYKSN